MTKYTRNFFPDMAPPAYAATLEQYESLCAQPAPTDPAEWARSKQQETRELADQQLTKATVTKDLAYYRAAWGNMAIWQDQSSCLGLDRATDGYPFFSPSDGRTENSNQIKARIAAAKEICQGCPVKDECLGYAVMNNEKNGIFGGFNMGRKRQREVAREYLADLIELLTADEDEPQAS